ncbi:helix-turn-helix domain-containing protein [Mycobacterium sp. IDR2000157661]|uniref:helix-turn-helix domain-containing protein n=1 Tax=Mycobacterium sp. IDR2000157661 TaxID=2867005 RepID=UPI002102CB2D|nr:helix-turn-helix domain-containing protein [Mycobacterium sp. IDR2000157661]
MGFTRVGAHRSPPKSHLESAVDTRDRPRRPVGRPRALSDGEVALANRLHASGVPKAAIARRLGVSRPTIYRALAGGSSTERAGTALSARLPSNTQLTDFAMPAARDSLLR